MNINVSRTREYYHSLVEELLCECDYCQNYRLQVKSAFPKISLYLDSFGIDIEKPFETSPLEPNENGTLEYCCCQYIVFGNCKSEYHHSIDNVEFRIAASHPSTGIEQEHFILEFFPIQLPFIQKFE